MLGNYPKRCDWELQISHILREEFNFLAILLDQG